MSQQEFVPQSQHSLNNNEDELYYPQHPYNWSERPNKEAAPRDEPPSSYDEPLIQRGYQAQDQHTSTQRQQFSPDGDAYEHRYRIYHQPQSLPPWARTQPRKKHIARLLFLIGLAALLIKPALILLIAIAGLISFALIAVALPLIFVVGTVSIFLLILRAVIRS